MITGQISRPGGREGISVGPSRIGKLWIEEGGRILLRVRKVRWGNGQDQEKGKWKIYSELSRVT